MSLYLRHCLHFPHHHYLRCCICLILTTSFSFSPSFSLFGVGASNFQSPRSPVLCFFYLYSFLLHVFSYNITTPQFRSFYLSVSTHFHVLITTSCPILTTMSGPSRVTLGVCIARLYGAVELSTWIQPCESVIFNGVLPSHFLAQTVPSHLCIWLPSQRYGMLPTICPMYRENVLSKCTTSCKKPSNAKLPCFLRQHCALFHS